MAENILTVSDLSRCLGISTDLIYTMVRGKQIPHIRVRRHILFHKVTIEDWLMKGNTA